MPPDTQCISIYKLGLYPLDWLWRPPRAAVLLIAHRRKFRKWLLALISLRETKPRELLARKPRFRQRRGRCHILGREGEEQLA
jgi:hypothetical protein